ncbi:rhombosortase [Stenotrophobium rhamnosiphilum]|uniref:Rhombosortase n=2 Tax=Stenotrophobium rhamnosiphilum TaxID=2029166 RepID=A0A2T5MH60_9GAMM|nr:rhombosortase [Stenotrophobium rhamnosiphilum]
MALLFFTQLLGESGREWLSYDRGLIEAGQWWRLITGSFVHLGWWHLFLNEMGLAVLVLLCPQPLSFAVWIRRLLILSLGMSLGLYFFVPSLNSYVGMSGVIHGLFLLGLVPQILKKDLIALGCLLYLIGKLAWELFSGAPVSDESALGGHVVLESHLFGTLTAFAYGIMFRVYKRTEIISLK